jgi:hypothetical protein
LVPYEVVAGQRRPDLQQEEVEEPVAAQSGQDPSINPWI